MQKIYLTDSSFECLKVVDCVTREILDIHVDQSFKGEDVVRVLKNIVTIRGKPMTLKTDYGSEFISKLMNKGAYVRGIELDFSRTGKPIENAVVGSLRKIVQRMYKRTMIDVLAGYKA